MKGGKLLLTESRGDSLAQRLTIRLRTHLDSWFLERGYGIDYFNRVFEKNIPKPSIDSLFQTAIYADERVEKILEFQSVLFQNVYRLSFKVKARNGVVSERVSITTSSDQIKIRI